MSQEAIIGVVVLMMMSSSVGAVALMMGGSPEEGTVCTPEGTKDANATYKYDADGECAMTCNTGYKNESGKCVESTPPPPPPPPPPPDFIIHETGDRVMGDLLRTGNQTLDQCKALCKANNDCIGISYNESEKICYQKGTTGGGSGGSGKLLINYNNPSPYQFYYKNVPGYEVKGAGDRVAGDIEGMPVTKESLKDCADVCNSKTNCVGFSYNSHGNVCYAKKAEGISPTYSNNGYQFYTKK